MSSSKDYMKEMNQSDFDPPLEKCPVCHSEDISYIFSDHKGIKIFSCNTCKSEFMNPQYTDKYLSDFYNQYQQKDTKNHRYDSSFDIRKIIHEHNIRQVEEYTKPGKFLSVGTGNGLDLMAAKERGWDCEGYDVDEDFVKELSEKIGIPIRAGEFAKLPYESGIYDCVYLSHVIEHPKNPGEYLDKISDLLKVGGVLYLATPNINSASIRIKRVLDAVGIRKKKKSYYDTWQHLIYYTPSRFKKMLEERFGFEVMMVGNDLKKVENGKVVTSALDGVTYKSSFRLIAKKR